MLLCVQVEYSLHQSSVTQVSAQIITDLQGVLLACVGNVLLPT